MSFVIFDLTDDTKKSSYYKKFDYKFSQPIIITKRKRKVESGNMETILAHDDFLFSKKQLRKKKNMIKEIERDGNWTRLDDRGSGSHITYNSPYISDLITVARIIKMNHIVHNLNHISYARQIKALKINIITE
tara:strand:- start:952 stop:1350 length:399 start_codon:yes stop_codon:yes gene_type:complete